MVGMKSKRQTPQRIKAAPFIVEAVTMGRGSVWLAEKAGIGSHVACELLAEYSEKVSGKVDSELGLHVESMRRVATAERERVTLRLQKVGAACDDLLATASGLIASLKANGGVHEVDVGDDVEDQGLERLERLAKVMQAAGKLAESSWSLFRSASGLALAERVTELKAREAIKAGDDDGEVWEADFELIESGE